MKYLQSPVIEILYFPLFVYVCSGLVSGAPFIISFAEPSPQSTTKSLSSSLPLLALYAIGNMTLSPAATFHLVTNGVNFTCMSFSNVILPFESL